MYWSLPLNLMYAIRKWVSQMNPFEATSFPNIVSAVALRTINDIFPHMFKYNTEMLMSLTIKQILIITNNFEEWLRTKCIGTFYGTSKRCLYFSIYTCYPKCEVILKTYSLLYSLLKQMSTSSTQTLTLSVEWEMSLNSLTYFESVW